MSRNEMTTGSPPRSVSFGDEPLSPHGRLRIHAAAVAGLIVLLTLVWAATSRPLGSFRVTAA
jgi:hypothetical protein